MTTDYIHTGDNLEWLKTLPAQFIDLIYIDPPFCTGHLQEGTAGAYGDKWLTTDLYIEWLTLRLVEIHRVLAPTGLLYLHCDRHASHSIKIALDQIFGVANFRNEIIWHYNSGARKAKDFGNRHDSIFRYSKGPDYYMNLDAARVPYSANIQIPASKAHYYNPLGKVVGDVWDIPIIAQNDKRERLGYPTQKPEALLERIILTSCPVGGIVADFFCGSGTTVAVAQRLGFSWLACDQSLEAVELTQARLALKPVGR